MTRLPAVCTVLTLLLCGCGGGPTAPPTHTASNEPGAASRPEASAVEGREGGKRKRRRRGSGGAASANNGGQEAAKFDFYVLSLSWSPGFCATAAGKNDDMQCGPERHFAFVLHGLWPQYERGGWPESCSTESVESSQIRTMLTIMPSPKLVAHEWAKHGTCSGLSPKDYFDEATEAFQSVKIPSPYKAPRQQIAVSPEQLRHDFASANPKIGDQGFVVLCSGNGRYLQEVRVCLTQELEGRSCNAEVLHDACRSGQVVMRPVR